MTKIFTQWVLLGFGARVSRKPIYPLSQVLLGSLPPIVRNNRQKATKRTKNRKTGALGSLKNPVVRPREGNARSQDCFSGAGLLSFTRNKGNFESAMQGR